MGDSTLIKGIKPRQMLIVDNAGNELVVTRRRDDILVQADGVVLTANVLEPLAHWLQDRIEEIED